MQPTPERRGGVTFDALVDLKCPPWFMDKPTGLRFSSSSVLQFNRPVQWQRPLSTPLRGFMVSVRWYSSPATSWVCFIWNERHASCCPTCQTGEFQPVRLWTVCAHTAQHFLNIRFHSASCWLRPCGVWNLMRPPPSGGYSACCPLVCSGRPLSSASSIPSDWLHPQWPGLILSPGPRPELRPEPQPGASLAPRPAVSLPRLFPPERGHSHSFPPFSLFPCWGHSEVKFPLLVSSQVWFPPFSIIWGN